MSRATDRTFASLSLWGVLSSLAAPPVWSLIRYLLFGDQAAAAWPQLARTLWGTPENLALSLFLVVCASLGFWILGTNLRSWREEAARRRQEVQGLEADLASRGRELDELASALNERMKQFHQTNAQLQKSLDQNEIMQLAADSLKEILGYDRVNLLMISPAGDRLEFVASRGTGDDNVAGVSLPMDERAGIIYLTMLNNEPILIRDMRDMPADCHLKPPCDTIPQLRSRSFILCPIVINGQVVGLIGVDNKKQRHALNEGDLDTVKIFAEQAAAALSKIDLLQAVEMLTGEIQSTFAQSLRHRRQFAQMIGEVKRDTSRSTDNVGKLRASSEALFQTVDDASSATSEISAAVHQVSQNLRRLNELMGQAISATREITAAVRATTEHAASSRQMADTVRREALEGVEMVGGNRQGLQKIADAMTASVSAFDALTESTENISGFLNLIKEINQKTQLLSLNASILAAQAGEHGRSFAVVADEIHTLYEETSGSAMAIEGLLEQIHRQTSAATREIGRTRSLVDEGVAVGQKTEQTLQKIAASASRALEFAGSIHASSQEQADNAEQTASSIQKMGDIAAVVSSASQEQALAITRIARQVDDIEGMAGTLAQAAGQQEQSAGHIDDMMDQVQELGQQIFSEIEKRRDESARVIERLDQLKSKPGQRTGEAGVNLVRPQKAHTAG